VTAIFYPDRLATSPDGRFTLDARSPHNGTIDYPDGTPAADDEFPFRYREHQRDFRYRLLESATGSVLWERWQYAREDSSHDLLVSDDGWSILRTHGFMPELIAVSPSGDDAMRVRLMGPDDSPSYSETQPVAPGRPEAPSYRWHLRHLAHTTGGHFWADNWCPMFFHWRGNAWFSCRTYWRQRLIIGLRGGRVVPEDDRSAEAAAVNSACDEREKQWASRVLSDLASNVESVMAWVEWCRNHAPKDEEEDDETQRSRALLAPAAAAANFAALHGMRDCVDALRRCERLEVRRWSTSSSAMPKGWWVEKQHLRPIVQHALRVLGEEPEGYPTYHFTSPLGETRFAVSERTPVTDERLSRVKRRMRATDVLELLGPPHFLRRQSHLSEKGYRWTEQWEYDRRSGGQWLTRRITWEERKRAGRIIGVEDVPPYWLDGEERVVSMLSM
jgi:hypothetical protein